MPGLALALVPTLLMSAQAPTDTFLHDYAVTRRFQNGAPSQARVTPDGKTVLFLRAQPTSPVQTLFAFDVATGRTRELLNPAALLHGASLTLSPQERARLERQRISARGLTGFQMSQDGRLLVVQLSGRPYVVELASGKVTAVPVDGALDPKLSPDGARLAYVRGWDLYVTDLATLKEHAVTHGGTETVTHGLAEFVAQEEMERFSGYWWSPDSRVLAYEESDTSQVEKLAIVDSMHPERGAQTVPYPRAGQKNARVRLGLVPALGGPTTWVAWDADAYPYLATVVWPDKGPLTLVVQNRTQTRELLLAVHPADGATKTLLVEEDKHWLNLDQAFPRWLKDGSAFLWHTERHGAPEVELRRVDGSLESTWLTQQAHFERLIGLDEAGQVLYYLSSPSSPELVLMHARPGEVGDRVLPDTGPSVQAGVVSRNGETVVVHVGTASAMPRTLVLHGGRTVGELPSVAHRPPFVPKLELRKVGPGEGYETYVVKPRAFMPGQKLPVIVSVYGGPTHNQVQASAAFYLLDQWLADQGFIVVGADNRGTAGRGAAWEKAIQGNFAELPMDDQVAALRALAQHVPEMDLTRVGIYGWSFGGYMSALAVLKRPDVFKAAVAGAPVADWRDYDTHYTERYLGLPQDNPEGYRKSSLLTYADGLKGSLLLLHGTADDNVYFFHSLKLSDALLRAGKEHQFLPLSGQAHGVSDPVLTEHLWRRVADFFKARL